MISSQPNGAHETKRGSHGRDKLDFVSHESLWGSECGGQDRRLGGHGTQLVYLHGGLQPTMR